MHISRSYYVVFLTGYVALGLTSHGVAGDVSRHSDGEQHSRARRSAQSLYDISPANRTLCQDGVEEPSNRVDTTSRVAALRQIMAEQNLDAYLIPLEDQHIGEPAAYDARLNYISGFSGSNGKAWVLGPAAGNKQAVWTDGRYFLQADQQMDCHWTLMGMPGTPGDAEWLVDALPEDARVGLDQKLVNINRVVRYDDAFLVSGKRLQLVAVDSELIDAIWTDDRPARPNEPLFIHTLEFTGKSWQDKITEIREIIEENEQDALFISALDETAWLFNLRGRDRNTSPLFYSYALLMQQETRLYLVNMSTLLTKEIAEHLNTNSDGTCGGREGACVNVREYDDAIATDLPALPADTRIWMSPSSNHAAYSAAGWDTVMLADSPIQLAKAVKNEVEKHRYRQCFMRDSAAVVDFVSQLEQKINDGERITELDGSDMLTRVRSEDDYYVMNSFDSISAVGANAAVIHYRPTADTDTVITKQAVYLLDSGGQYFDGTTDVTRTFHFGEPTDNEVEAYTRVLIGAIELATTVWPNIYKGCEIDARTRVSLWEHGWDYNHGTGHGIGYFLNVHEGPGRINMGCLPSHAVLQEGMFFSDEPGYYEEGYFGIRLETIVEVVAADTPNQFNDVVYLTFHPVTLVPFEPKLIDYDMLNARHRRWLNEYHARCEEETGSYLLSQGKRDAYEWLKERTARVPDVPVWTADPPSAAAALQPLSALSCILIYVLGYLMYL